MNQEIWYKIVTNAYRSSYVPIYRSFCKIYKKSTIVTASKGTPGIFIFKNIDDAKSYFYSFPMLHGNIYKIIKVKPINRPKRLEGYVIDIWGLKTIKEIKESMKYKKYFKIMTPDGTYVCRSVYVIGDIDQGEY